MAASARYFEGRASVSSGSDIVPIAWSADPDSKEISIDFSGDVLVTSMPALRLTYADEFALYDYTDTTAATTNYDALPANTYPGTGTPGFINYTTGTNGFRDASNGAPIGSFTLEVP